MKLRPLAEFTIATMLVIGILECMFALSGIGEQEYLRPDKVLGFSLIPNKSVTWRKEGFSRVQINSVGMQDIERAKEKPANVFRIAVIGDSFVESLQVHRADNFLNLLESRLNDLDGEQVQRVEVLNFGVSSYNLGQMYLQLKDQVLDYQPDLVILPVRMDTTFYLVPNPDGGFLWARPSFFLDGKGKLLCDYSVQETWNRTSQSKRMEATAWLRQNSRIWGVVSKAAEGCLTWYNSLAAVDYHVGADITKKTTAFAPGIGNAGHEPGPSRWNTPLSAEAQAASDGCTRTFWPVAHQLISEMSQECRGHKCALAVVRLPSAHQYDNVMETSMLRDTASTLMLPYLDLSKAFPETEDGKLFIHTHYSARGHRLLAEKMFPFVETLYNATIAESSASSRQGQRVF
ncbi:MAG: SGNH/GDSL hydrolase family protein [Candidatus Obscuribacterales bacterium]